MRNLLALGLVVSMLAAVAIACGDKNEKPPLTPDSDKPALDADGGAMSAPPSTPTK